MSVFEVPLSDGEKRLIRSLTTGAPRWRRGYCLFCGGFTFGRVCRAHMDLVEVEAEPLAPQRENTSGSDEEGR